MNIANNELFRFLRFLSFEIVSTFAKDGANLELALTNPSSLGKPGPLGANTVIVLPAGSSNGSSSGSATIDSTDGVPLNAATAVSDTIPISLTSIPLTFTVSPVTTSAGVNTETIITELPCDAGAEIVSTVTHSNERKAPNSETSSSAASTLSKRKPKHSEVYV